MPRLRKLITVERLAVAVFVAVAFGLWWGMQSQPEVTFTLRSENRFPHCWLSPDGTLGLIQESQFEIVPLPGEAAQGPPPWQCRLRVFDLTTGQEVWQWTSAAATNNVMWTPKNHLFMYRTGKTKTEVVWVDPKNP